MSAVIGWDVGGAHLKAARVAGGRVEATVQVPCTLWRGLDHLGEALAAARALIGDAPRHAVTTTGELVDAFADREAGVVAIANALEQALAPAEVQLYAGRAGFVAVEEAGALWGLAASANWHATASVVARARREALMIDMGSTTTDVVPIADGLVRARGMKDHERMVVGELVYTGLTRTFLMSGPPLAPVGGSWAPLMNEYFASMADVWRVLGELDEMHDQHPAADGREKTPKASAARLARMVGLDRKDRAPEDWARLARWFAEGQMRRIEDAVHLVLSAGSFDASPVIVAAGAGQRVIARIAARQGMACEDLAAVIPVAPAAAAGASLCAPAACVGLLLASQPAGEPQSSP
jgi:probable H4MPT-linked C1 transfer pathway protein